MWLDCNHTELQLGGGGLQSVGKYETKFNKNLDALDLVCSENVHSGVIPLLD